MASSTSQAPPPEMALSDACQMCFEERMIQLTASAGLLLSWVENPDWLNFCTEFILQAKSLSLTQCLLPWTLGELQSQAKQQASGKNATALCDGWTGESFYHYIAFMIIVGKEVQRISTLITQIQV